MLDSNPQILLLGADIHIVDLWRTGRSFLAGSSSPHSNRCV